MSTHRYPGGVISAYPVIPSASGAVGVWTLEEALRSKAANNWPDGTGLDPYFKNTTLLLHGDGTNGAQNNTFLDSSTNNFTITRNGNTTQGSFDPYAGPGCWSNYFDGTGDYLTAPASSLFAFGTGNFTVEAWVYPTVRNATYGSQIAGCHSYLVAADWIFMINTSGNLYFQISNSAVGAQTSTSTVALNAWSHVAVVRSSGTVAFYINGVAAGSGSYTTSVATTQALGIGAANNGSAGSALTGYISNLRIVNGAAVYTSAFTPSTTPLVATTQTTLLTCNSNGFIDQSAANNVLTRNGDVAVSKFSPFTLYQITPASYSGYFDGTNSNLTVPSNTALTLGSGNFTVEAWVYLSGTQTTTYGYQVLGTYAAVANGYALVVNRSSGGPLGLAWSNGTPTSTKITYGTYLNTNTWYHIAVVRTSTATNGVTIYLNGSAVATGTDATNDSVLQTLYVGSQGAGQYFPGSISNVRITKGQALYTSNFTPSTLPLTTTSQGATAANVSLLTCQSTTFIDNSTNAFAITANGNAQPRIANPFTDTVAGPTAYSAATYGGSAYFDGTGDYLSIANNAAFNFGTGDFTVEFWMYPLAPANNARMISNGPYNASGIDISWESGASPAGRISWYIATTPYYTTFLPPSYAWVHIVFSRQGTSFKVFVNGALNATYTNSTNITSANALLIGALSPGAANPVTAYMTGVRINKGTAVYTAPFIPPTTPPTAITNTQLLLNTNNAGIFDNTTVTDLETSGSAQISTSVVKYGTGSISFNGTNSYLTLSNNSSTNMTFGTGDFTIEAWIYPTSFTGQTNVNMIIDFRPLSTNGAYVCFYLALTTGYPILTVSNSNVITGTTAPTLNAWNHIALTRSGTSTRVFINGNQTGSTYTDSTNYLGSVGRPIIGATGFFAPADYFTGYMDEIRITKGVARYTANFTPPTSPFPNT